MKRLSRTRLFLLEMLVNLLVFCVGAAICLLAFAHAYAQSAESRVISQAQRVTENAAMAFRSTGGDLSALPGLLTGVYEEDTFTVWYSQDWQPVRRSQGIYRLEMVCKAIENDVLCAEIAVYPPEGEAVAALSVCQYIGSAWNGAPKEAP